MFSAFDQVSRMFVISIGYSESWHACDHRIGRSTSCYGRWFSMFG